MKILKRLLILLLIQNSCNLLGYQNSFESNEFGLKIYISDIEFSIEKHSLSNDSSSLRILNCEYSYPSNLSNYAIDEFNFPIALPNFEYDLKFNIHSFDTINNIILAEKIKNSQINSNLLSNSTSLNYIINNEGFYIDLVNKGKKRGVNVATLVFIPTSYDKINKRLIIAKSVTLNLTFRNPITINNSINLKELRFFSTYINQEHIPTFINLSNNKESDRVLKKANWYYPDKKYLKVITNKDGISILEAKEIIEKDNSFNGLNIDWLHLLWEGEEYPIYIQDNGNHNIDDGDVIYFLGKRANGDTTWFDFYTSEATFYLLIDSSKKGLRLNEFPIVDNPSKTIESVGIEYHIEEEHVYMYGYYPELYENVDGELWAWKIISPWDNLLFNDTLSIFPTKYPDDSIIISVRFKSNRYNTKYNTNHRLRYVFNTDTILTKEFPAKAGSTLVNTFKSKDIIAGGNLLTIQSLGFYANNELIIPDEVGIDYINIQGNIAPNAIHGKSDFYINRLNENSSLNIAGYQSDTTVFIDTENNFIKITNKNNRGTLVAAGVKSGSNGLLSISLNDSTFIKTGFNGMMVGVCPSPNHDSYEFKTFENNYQDFINYIKNIPSESIITITINSENELSAEVKDCLIELGSKTIADYIAGNCYTIIIRKNSNNQIFEKLSSNAISSLFHFIEHPNGKSFQAKLNLKEKTDYHIISADLLSSEKCRVEFTNQSDLQNTANQADVLIIYHKAFKEAAEMYYNFRKNNHKNYNFILIDVEDIYKEFYYGRKSPHSIKNFLRYSATNWQKPSPSFVVLFGDACWDTRKIMNTTTNIDFISTYGVPSSELWFCLLDDKDYIADIELGRIPARTPEQAIDYVNKIIQYENSPLEPWKKNILYLAGGFNIAENNQFYNAVEYYGSIITDSKMCVDTFITRKRNFSSVSSYEKDEIISRINKGMAWITFLGHGSPQFFDMDGWQVEYLDNKNKYSIFNSLSCNTGAFAEPIGTCRNEDYLLASNKGFISTSASTGVSFVDIDIEFHLRVSRILSKIEDKMPTVIEIFNLAKSQMLRNDAEILTAMTYSMLGDPLIALHIDPQPDLYFLSKDIEIQNSQGEDIITENDTSAVISGIVYNGGYSKPGAVKLLLIREYLNRIDSSYLEYSRICPDAYFKFVLPVLNMPGIHKITLIADPEETYNDINYSNNKFERYFEVFVKSLLPLEPLAYWDKEPQYPVFRVINPEPNPETYGYEFEITEGRDISKILKKSIPEEIEIKEAFIEWKPELRLVNDNSYLFLARAINPNDSTKTPVLIIPFTASNNYANDKVHLKMKAKEHLSFFEINGFELVENGDSSFLRIKNDYYPYRIISANGNQSVERFGEIKFRDTTHIVSENAGDVPVGFNFVIISGSEGYFKLKRNFYTWGKYDWWNDSTGINMVKFLRDSVDSNDYVLIATCDQSFRLFEYHRELKTSGSLDTLISVLKEYGSQYADSLRWGCSFAMVGKRGAKKGSLPEFYDTTGGKIIIQDSLKFYKKYAYLITPWIGPSKHWINCSIEGFFEKFGCHYRITINGRDRFNSNEKEVLKLDTSLYLTLDSISTIENAYLKYKFELFRDEDTLEPKVYEISSQIIPTEEFAILKSSSHPLIDSILRGEIANLQFAVQNISARASSLPNSLEIKIYSKNGEILSNELYIDSLSSSSIATLPFSNITDNFDNHNIVSSSVNLNNSKNELYYFNNNNSYSFHIYEDTIKPDFIFKLDGKVIQNGDNVSLIPKAEILMFDNSPRPIDSSKIIVRINGYIQPQPRVKDYLFTSYDRDVPLKAKLTFTSDSLDYRDNVFIIKGTDASGNETELLVYVFVSPKGAIESIKNYPNPFSNNTHFKLRFVSPINEALASIYIFDELGKKVRSLEKKLFIGENDFVWDAKDDYGNTLPTGLYIYLILVKNNVYVEPVRGTCLYIR